MSTRIVPALVANYQVVIGFDPGMSVFYGQVWDKAALDRGADEDEALLDWMPFQMLGSPETLARAMSRYVQIEPVMLAMLHMDASKERSSLPRDQAKCSRANCNGWADVICDECDQPLCPEHSWHTHTRSETGCSQFIYCNTHTWESTKSIYTPPSRETRMVPPEYLTVIHRGTERVEVADRLLFNG